MGIIDAESKKYFSDNSRFADTFNYLVYNGEDGGVDMYEALEKRYKEKEVLEAIKFMQATGEANSDIIVKIAETFNVSKDYVLALLTPQEA